MNTKAIKQLTATALAIPAIVLVFAFSSQIQAQSGVRSQLDEYEDYASDKGYSSTHNYFIDSIDEGEKDRSNLTLRKGMSYEIVVVCDDDCSDVDLQVIDENGNVVAKDEDGTSLAIAKVTPRWTGKFKIQVHMYSCSIEPCYYGIGVFGK